MQAGNTGGLRGKEGMGVMEYVGVNRAHAWDPPPRSSCNPSLRGRGDPCACDFNRTGAHGPQGLMEVLCG